MGWSASYKTISFADVIPLGLMAVFLGKGETWGMQTD